MNTTIGVEIREAATRLARELHELPAQEAKEILIQVFEIYDIRNPMRRFMWEAFSHLRPIK